MELIKNMTHKTAKAFRWVLTDIDDTMTMDGMLVPEAYTTLCELSKAGLKVIAVTGRSAGWGIAHLQEWPLDGAITENGAVSYFRDNTTSNSSVFGTIVHPSAVRNTDPAFLRASEAAYRLVPRARPANDNYLRLYDWAIDHAEYTSPALSDDEIQSIVSIFEKEGCVAKPSSIHINAWIGTFDKRQAAFAFLNQREVYDDSCDREKVLYVGDALNDEVMFEYFPNACAVANIDKWLPRLKHTPAWVSSQRFGAGFSEIGQTVLSLR